MNESTTAPDNGCDRHEADENQQQARGCGHCSIRESTGPFVGDTGVAIHHGKVHSDDLDPLPVEPGVCHRGQTKQLSDGRPYCAKCGLVDPQQFGDDGGRQ